jgi:hypothetical protein
MAADTIVLRNSYLEGSHGTRSFRRYCESFEFDCARKYARHGVQIWRSGSVDSPIAEEIQAPVVTCLIFETMSDWHFGQIASCHALLDEGI